MKNIVMFFFKGVVILILIAGLLQLEYNGKKLDSYVAGSIKSTIGFFKGDPVKQTKHAAKEGIREAGKKSIDWLDEKSDEGEKRLKASIESKTNDVIENLDEMKKD